MWHGYMIETPGLHATRAVCCTASKPCLSALAECQLEIEERQLEIAGGEAATSRSLYGSSLPQNQRLTDILSSSWHLPGVCTAHGPVEASLARLWPELAMYVLQIPFLHPVF